MSSFDFADVLDEAVALSGGESATAADVISARRSMHLLLIEWKNRGFNTWRIKHENYGVGQNGQVTLPSKVDDIFQVSSNNPKGGSCFDFMGAQANMRRITADEYANLTTLPQGRPSMFYLERTEPPTVFVYPIGRPGISETLEIWYIERPPEFDRYGNDPDGLPQRWLNALVSGVAVRMAKKRPGTEEEKIERLGKDYINDLELCTNNDRERVNLRVRIGMNRGRQR
jgi:hypothetical protein